MKKILFTISILISLSLFAGGPMITDGINTTGVPPRWKDGIVRWRVDGGKMSDKVSHEEAMNEWILPIISNWENITMNLSDGSLVKTANVRFVLEGSVSQDINASNYKGFVFEEWTDQPTTVVIFDADGSIIKDLVEEEGWNIDPDGTIGLGQPNPDSDNVSMTGGFIIINGKLFDGVKDIPTRNYEISKDRMMAAIKHEFGHLLNLDHSQVNKNEEKTCLKESQAGGCSTGQHIVTMFPKAMTGLQATLHRDDKISVSRLYPSRDFEERFCIITGQLLDSSGVGAPGINVVARNIRDSRVDSRAMVTGVLFPLGIKDDRSPDGSYYLSGLLPGQDYQVTYESLHQEFADASGFEPINNPPQIPGGLVLGKNGENTVSCEAGGEIIEMPDFSVQLPKAFLARLLGPDATPAEGGPSEEGTDQGGQGAASDAYLKNSCSLVAAGLPASSFDFIWLLFIPIFYIIRRKSPARKLKDYTS